MAGADWRVEVGHQRLTEQRSEAQIGGGRGVAVGAVIGGAEGAGAAG
jgi:hypothetical protein